jgi:integral membrane protein
VISLKSFRYVALAEATSFLVLLVASILKRTTDTDLVPILGPLHGALFVAYIAMAVFLRPDQKWDTQTFALILLGAVVPFGGYVVDRKLLTSSSRSTATS